MAGDRVRRSDAQSDAQVRKILHFTPLFGQKVRNLMAEPVVRRMNIRFCHGYVSLVFRKYPTGSPTRPAASMFAFTP